MESPQRERQRDIRIDSTINKSLRMFALVRFRNGELSLTNSDIARAVNFRSTCSVEDLKGVESFINGTEACINRSEIAYPKPIEAGNASRFVPRSDLRPLGYFHPIRGHLGSLFRFSGLRLDGSVVPTPETPALRRSRPVAALINHALDKGKAVRSKRT